MQLFAITGLRGHGKTTAAQALESVGFRHVNFADPVKRIVEEAYGIPWSVLNDPVLKETMLDVYPFKTPREVMQQVGTEMFRHYLDDTWIEAFKRNSARFSHVVCSDLRFPNEAEAVRIAGGKIVKVVNPRINLADAASLHASEALINGLLADVVIVNDGSIADLHAKVKAYAHV